MGLNLERLAEALKIPTSFTQEDRDRINNMRENGIGLYSARDELFAGKILKRITELVEKVEGNSTTGFIQEPAVALEEGTYIQKPAETSFIQDSSKPRTKLVRVMTENGPAWIPEENSSCKEASTLKERFDEAFYGLLEAGNNLQKVSEKLDEVETLIKKNKAKQKLIKEVLEGE